MPDKPGRETEQRIIARNQAAEERTPSLAAEMDRLFETNRPQIYRLCLRMTGDPQRAEELTQETLLVAYKRLDEFRMQARFSTWIYGIARNLSRNARRKRSETLTEDGVFEPGSVEADALQALQDQERVALLKQAAAALSPIEQEAIHLRYVEHLSQDEITAVLSLDGSGARGLLQRCRRKLRRALTEKMEALGHGESLFLTRG
ncbi:MAG: RNA polymerase sigma factor [Myxococcota bacterium]